MVTIHQGICCTTVTASFRRDCSYRSAMTLVRRKIDIGLRTQIGPGLLGLLLGYKRINPKAPTPSDMFQINWIILGPGVRLQWQLQCAIMKAEFWAYNTITLNAQLLQWLKCWLYIRLSRWRIIFGIKLCKLRVNVRSLWRFCSVFDLVKKNSLEWLPMLDYFSVLVFENETAHQNELRMY